jgi:hypothetical protein
LLHLLTARSSTSHHEEWSPTCSDSIPFDPKPAGEYPGFSAGHPEKTVLDFGHLSH